MKYFIDEILKYNEKTFIVTQSKHERWTDCQECVFKRVCKNCYYIPCRFSDCGGRYYKNNLIYV